jgi:hypothetical protein
MRTAARWVIFSLLVILLLLAYIYPYSNISFYKSTTYNPDKVFVNEYTRLLNKFKSTESINESDDTSLTTRRVLSELNKPWLINKNSTQISKASLEQQIKRLQRIKNSLVQLESDNAQDYGNNTLAFLLILIENTDALIVQFEQIKDSNFKSRVILQREFSNVHMGFSQYLKMTISFYESYKSMK